MSQLTYKTGSIGEFMRWTKRVVADPAAATEAPKQWFETVAAAEKAYRGKLIGPE